MRTESIRSKLAGALVVFVVVLGTADIGVASTPEETVPATTEAEPEPDETTGTTVAGETQNEPGEVSPWVWIGVIVLLAAAIVWAVRRGSTVAPPDDLDADSVTEPGS